MPKVDMADMADTGVMENTANILAQCRNEADTHLAEAGRNSAGRDRAKHIEAGAAVNGAAVTGPAVIGTAVTGAAETGAALTGMAVTGTAVADSSLSADLVTRTTGVGIHIGVGAILTLTRTTAIILTGTILRTGTSTTTAPYQDGDIFTPDPSVPSKTVSMLFLRIADSSSRNAVSFSSARTTFWVEQPPVVTVIGKAFFDIGHAPADHSNRRTDLQGYAAWEIHPVMKLDVQ